MVDLLWLGLPVVATEGGTMSRVIDEIGAGATVPPGDPQALVATVRSLFDDPPARDAAARAGRSWAATRRWRDVAAPLLEFAARPEIDPNKDRFVDLAPQASDAEEPIRNRLQRVMKRMRGGR